MLPNEVFVRAVSGTKPSNVGGAGVGTGINGSDGSTAAVAGALHPPQSSRTTTAGAFVYPAPPTHQPHAHVGGVGGDASSLLARPHSRQYAAGAASRTIKAAKVHEAQDGRIWSPPRLRQQCNPQMSSSAATPPPPRSRSPQQVVRSVGRALVNPHTVFTSSVAASLVTTSHERVGAGPATDPTQGEGISFDGARGTHASTSGLSKSLPASPLRLSNQPPSRSGKGENNTTHTHNANTTTSSSLLQLSSIAVRVGSSVPETPPRNQNAAAIPPGGPTTPSYNRRDEVEVFGMDALRRGYGTTLDAVATNVEGCLASDLRPVALPLPDLRKLDLTSAVPRHSHSAIVKPKVILVGDETHLVLEVPHSTVSGDDGGTAGGADAAAAGSGALVFTFERFAARVIDVDETGLDRAVQFLVEPELPQMFWTTPTIDENTGTLSLQPNPLAAGTCQCFIRVVDYAMVDDHGNVAMSEPVAITITVARVKGTAAATQSSSATHGRSGETATGAAAAASRGKTTAAAAAARQHAFVHLATAADFVQSVAPDELLRLQAASLEGTAVRAGGDGASGASEPHYTFPATNPHELRYDEVTQGNALWIAQHPTSTTSHGDRVPIPTYRPCFDVPLADIELVRLGRASVERDRLAGEEVRAELRADFESRLLERIRAEERSVRGVDSVELCPLLLRLAQLYMMNGSRQQGDVVELLERIARIRLSALGISGFDALENLSTQFGLSNSMAGSTAGANHNMSMTSGGVLKAADLLSGSIFHSAAKVTSSGGGGGEGSGSFQEGDAAGTSSGTSKESKKFDSFHQSLLLLCLYLKLSGRYQEMLDFATYAVHAAVMAYGDGSVPHLRATSEAAEANLLLGNVREARSLFDSCVLRSEVHFGADAAATHNLMHALGIAYAAEGDYSHAMVYHDRVLRSRQKRNDPNEHLALAESYLLSAWTRVQAQSGQAPQQERVSEYLEAAVGILNSIVVGASDQHQQLPVALAVGRAGLMVLAARIVASRGEKDRAIQMLIRASDAVSSVLGFESQESALVQIPLAALKLSKYCEGWEAPGHTIGTTSSGAVSATHSTVPVAEIEQALHDTSAAVAALQQSNTVLLNWLGHQHPHTVRCAALLAEVRMYRNAKQSALTVERCTASAKRLLHPSHPDQMVLNHLSAKIHLLTRDNKSALVEAATAHAVAAEWGVPDVRMVELETTFIGALCRNSDEPPAPILIAILESRVKSVIAEHGETSPLCVRPMQNLAEAYFLLSDFARAHHFLSRALKIADAVNFIFLLGNLLKPVAQLSVADAQERNRIARDRIHTNMALQFAEILFQIAAVFDAEGKSEEAQSTYLQALASQEIAGVTKSVAIVQTLSALSALLYTEGHFGDALAYAEKAHSMLLEHFPTHSALLASVCDLLRVISFRLRTSGYTLLRHPDSRHRFTTYV